VEGKRQWIFHAKIRNNEKRNINVDLIEASKTPIKRHIKFRAHDNPFDQQWDEYFDERENKSRCQSAYLYQRWNQERDMGSLQKVAEWLSDDFGGAHLYRRNKFYKANEDKPG
jgi:hypothetical protein